MIGTCLFAGGGTGGHIAPALAIAEHLADLADIRSRFLCSTKPVDVRMLTQAGAEFEIIPAVAFRLNPAGAMKFLTHWPSAVRAAKEAVSRAESQGPVVIAAMGGYVAAPVAAARGRTPIVLINLDAVPGRANRWIASRATTVLTAATVPNSPWREIGPIVRRSAIADAPPQVCRERLGLSPRQPTLLFTGGSQGATSINQLALALVAQRREAFGEADSAWQIVHQTGTEDLATVREAYARAGISACVEAFFDRMGQAWGAADLAVSRAGAGSVAEAWANHVPTVFLPYPYHRDEHQKHNAAKLVTSGAAALCRDQIDARANLGEAGSRIVRLMGDATARCAMRQAAVTLGDVRGARLAAEAVIQALAQSHTA